MRKLFLNYIYTRMRVGSVVDDARRLRVARFAKPRERTSKACEKGVTPYKGRNSKISLARKGSLFFVDIFRI